MIDIEKHEYIYRLLLLTYIKFTVHRISLVFRRCSMSLGAGLHGGNANILLPLSHHAQNTLCSLSSLHSGNTMKLSPFCHEHPEGAHEVRGWSLDTLGSAPACSLPINCSMFDGVSIVKCDCSEVEILQLLSDAEDTRRRLGNAISQIMDHTITDEMNQLRASWRRCRPSTNGTPQSLCSAHVLLSTNNTNGEKQVNFFNTEDCVPLIDSDIWIPELSPEGFIGIYHHWNHAKTTNDTKGPSLYIICQSYLPTACLEFADMVRDLGDVCTTSDVYHSEEAQWLRHACARNRGRLIAEVCREMKIKFPAMVDYNACKTGERTMIAISTIETLHHDLQSIPIKSMMGVGEEKELIRLFNFCTSSPNSACVMSPWDGVWVFHGQNHQSHHFLPSITPKIAEQDRASLKHGKNASIYMFSTNVPETCDVLDIYLKKEIKSKKKRKALSSGMVKNNNTYALEILGSIEDAQFNSQSMIQDDDIKITQSEDADVMLAYNRSVSKMSSLMIDDKGVRNTNVLSKKKTFLYFDEHVLNAMEKHGWTRSNGYTTFIPLACGLCEHWRRLVYVDTLSD